MKIKINDTVEVIDGMWDEMLGIVEKIIDNDKIEVLISTFGQEKSVVLRKDQVKKVKEVSI